MDTGTRWTAVAFLVGFCAAYSMWGGTETPIVAQKHSTKDTPEQPDLLGTKDPHAVPPQTPGAQSALKCKPFAVEFGEVPLGERRTATVQITNTSGAAITVLEIHPSCGCVHGRLEKTKIEPGQSAPMEVGFHADQGKRVGNLTLTLATDEAGHPRVVVPIMGKTRQEFTIEPALLRFGKLQKNEVKTVSAAFVRVDGKPFQIERVQTQNKDVEFEWEPIPGVSGYTLKATAKGARAGQFTEAAAIFTDHPTQKVISLPLVLDVAPEIVCTPSDVRADQLSDKSVAPFETVVKRQTAGRLEIESIKDSADIPMTFSAERINEASVRLKLQLKGAYPQRIPFGQFLIKTNCDAEPVPLPYRVIMPVPGKAKPATAPETKK
ncbi:MAG TPA: DUF1573 domain-containing protein [Planctomycetota bacterium]|nr:DUF1573 domain-containing protein [Planctomycetota bacterium]